MRAPRSLACSSSSSTRHALPSAITKPSRLALKGRLAFWGSSLRVLRACMALNPPTPLGTMAASAPPLTIMSALPRRMRLNASASALDEEAQADEVMKLGPWNPYMMEIWPAQMSAIILGMKKGPNLGPSVAPVFVQLPTSSSKVFMPPMPTPYTTPMRFLSAVSRSMPQSLMPWMAPASAYWQ